MPIFNISDKQTKRILLLMGIPVYTVQPTATTTALQVCEKGHEKYRYKSAIFQVNNAKKINVTFINSMCDRYPSYFTAWMKVN